MKKARSLFRVSGETENTDNKTILIAGRNAVEAVQSAEKQFGMLRVSAVVVVEDVIWS